MPHSTRRRVALGLRKLREQAAREPVEEARQHSAVRSESFTFGRSRAGRSLADSAALGVVAGVVGYFYIGGRSILLGLLAFTLSRALMRFWQIARPHASRGTARPRSITMAFAIMWMFAFDPAERTVLGEVDEHLHRHDPLEPQGRRRLRQGPVQPRARMGVRRRRGRARLRQPARRSGALVGRGRSRSGRGVRRLAVVLPHAVLPRLRAARRAGRSTAMSTRREGVLEKRADGKIGDDPRHAPPARRPGPARRARRGRASPTSTTARMKPASSPTR